MKKYAVEIFLMLIFATGLTVFAIACCHLLAEMQGPVQMERAGELIGEAKYRAEKTLDSQE